MTDILWLIGAAVGGYFMLSRSGNGGNTGVDEDGTEYAEIPMDSIEYGTVDEYNNDVPLKVSSTWNRAMTISGGIVYVQGKLHLLNVSDEEVTIEYPDLQLGNYIPQKGPDGYFDKMVSSVGCHIGYMTSATITDDGMKFASSAAKIVSLPPGETKSFDISFSINTNKNPAILKDNNTSYYKFPFSVVMEYSKGLSSGKYTICAIVEGEFKL